MRIAAASRLPVAVVGPMLALMVLGAGCGQGGRPPYLDPGTGSPAGGIVQVVAAENFWGSIAAQVGGSHTRVRSIITDPNADPHAYEPTPADARAIASASLVIENGIGYDPWTLKLRAADPTPPVVLDVGQVVGVAPGANPHRWYDPGDVQRVVAAYTADLSGLDPGNAGYFRAQASRFEAVSLEAYRALTARIKTKYAGTPVGASESIFSLLAPALGLRLVTPSSFLRAVSEGTEVSSADKATIDHQIQRHLIKIYVYNAQNTTPEIQAQLQECRAAGIPIAKITETLVPSTTTFQAWQASQLQGIADALARATGR